MHTSVRTKRERPSAVHWLKHSGISPIPCPRFNTFCYCCMITWWLPMVLPWYAKTISEKPIPPWHKWFWYYESEQEIWDTVQWLAQRFDRAVTFWRINWSRKVLTTHHVQWDIMLHRGVGMLKSFDWMTYSLRDRQPTGGVEKRFSLYRHFCDTSTAWHQSYSATTSSFFDTDFWKGFWVLGLFLTTKGAIREKNYNWKML